MKSLKQLLIKSLERRRANPVYKQMELPLLGLDLTKEDFEVLAEVRRARQDFAKFCS